MRVLYVAPRYHTNQVPVIKGWLERGHQVVFLSQFAGEGEDYSDLQPMILGYSKAYEILAWVLKWTIYRGRQSVKQNFDLRIKIGFPPLKHLYRIMEEFQPDLVIMRERSVYNIPVQRWCRKRKVHSILYNQSPLWDDPKRDDGWIRKMLISAMPRNRMTPVYGIKNGKNVRMPDSYYVPFVAEVKTAPDERKYFENGKINILCVARYEERKRLFMLADAVAELVKRGSAVVRIVGEAVDPEQEEYYDRLKNYITEKNEKGIILLKNFNRKQIFDEYKRADLFVLPSTRERASISQLEAMSCSVPVICSDTNGSACYVEEGINGYLFQDDSESDLKDKIERMSTDQEELLKMAYNSYRLVKEKYQFENYYCAITEIMKKAKK